MENKPAEFKNPIPMSTNVYSEEHGWGVTFTGITGIDENTSVKFGIKRVVLAARLIIGELIPAAEKLIKEGKGPDSK